MNKIIKFNLNIHTEYQIEAKYIFKNKPILKKILFSHN